MLIYSDSYPTCFATQIIAKCNIASGNSKLLINEISFPIDISQVDKSQIYESQQSKKVKLKDGIVMLVDKPTKSGVSPDGLDKIARCYQITSKDFRFFMPTNELKQLIHDLQYKDVMCAKDALQYSLMVHADWRGLVVYRKHMAEFTWTSNDDKWHGVVFIEMPKTLELPGFQERVAALLCSMDISDISQSSGSQIENRP